MATLDTFRDFDRLAGALFASRPSLREMPLDLYREGDRYIILADLPGIDPETIDVDVDGRQLTIRAERTIRRPQDAKWIIRERSGGTFVRQLTMGEGIDVSAISANYNNGVLTVTMPMSESVKPRKVIVETVVDQNDDQSEETAGVIEA